MAEPTQSDRVATNGAPAPKPRTPRARHTSPKSEATGPTAASVTAAAGLPADTTNFAINRNGAEAVIAGTVAIAQGGVGTITADSVTITQGGATTVSARTVDVRQGGIAMAQADDIAVSMGGVAVARADRVSVEMGGLGLAVAREAHLTQGAARAIVAQEIHVDQGLVGSAMAGRITFTQPSGVLLLIAGRVDVRSRRCWTGAVRSPWGPPWRSCSGSSAVVEGHCRPAGGPR